MAGGQHPAVVIQFGARKVTSLRFYAGPLNGESIAVEPQALQQADVRCKAVIVITGVKRWLAEEGRRAMLQHPQIAVDVVSFDLVGSCGGTPNETLGERSHPARGSRLREFRRLERIA